MTEFSAGSGGSARPAGTPGEEAEPEVDASAAGDYQPAHRDDGDGDGRVGDRDPDLELDDGDGTAGHRDPDLELDGGDELDGTAAGGAASRRRGRGRIGVALAAAGAIVVATGWVGWASGWFGLNGSAEASNEPAAEAPAETVEVTRQTLTQNREIDGIIGYGDVYTLVTSNGGVITGLADQGAEVERGMEFYRLNEQPTVALFGAIPMYRDLQPGSTGVDVEQLEENLAELGYDGFTVDDQYTDATASAVRQWQEDLGIPETGVVRQSDVVFLSDDSRIDAIHTDVGGVVTQGSPVLDVTGADQVVSLEVEVADRDLLAVDTEVTVVLPDGDQVAGVVTAARVVPDPTAEGDGGAADTITQVDVTLDEAVDEALLGAPADVIVDIDEREDVLAVPVSALLALTGGGHGVEVVAEDGSVSVVPVESGMFADGMVEIEGAGITEGTVVGVAGR